MLVPVSVIAQNEQLDLTPPEDLLTEQNEQPRPEDLNIDDNESTPEQTQQNEPSVPPTPGQFSEQTTVDASEQQELRQKSLTIVARCDVVKQRISTHKDTFTDVQQKHSSVISRVSSKLDQLVARIEAHDAISDTQLSTLVESLRVQTSSFEVETESYKEAIDMLIEKDCTNQDDAADFYGALKTLREDTASLKDQRKEIRKLIAEDIKSELAAIKDQLQNNQTDQQVNGQEGYDG
jgi:predicted nucleic-acid-binding protein